MTDSLTVALIQLNVGDDPATNLSTTSTFIAEAASRGAQFVLTPEATNVLTPDAERRARVLQREGDDPTLAALRAQARDLGIWLLIGSLSLKADGIDESHYANRSFLITPEGDIAARYDKLHMFDVRISDTEAYRESASFRPGDRAVVAQGPAPIGMSVCYDVRFPYLYRRLAQSGARILTVPAAFNDTTGAAHWEVLLRARAIETGCFVLAPAQTGIHPTLHSPEAKKRRSWGHSLAVAPWGEVLADAGEAPGVTVVSLDLEAVDRARSRVPSLTHDRDFTGP